MCKLSREDLFSLEKYAEIRSEFRANVMAHKRNRKVGIGPNATLYFEDIITVQYQIQEMLRIEKIFEAEGIQGELDAYNPLIPDGSNWKATFMLEYTDPAERKAALKKLIGIEKQVWVKVAGLAPVAPITNEDLERDTEGKTSSVHFMRFELSDEMITAAKTGASIAIGVDHAEYRYQVAPLEEAVRASLLNDLA